MLSEDLRCPNKSLDNNLLVLLIIKCSQIHGAAQRERYGEIGQ